MELDKKSLKKMFPNLAKEMGSEENRVDVNSVRTDDQLGEKAVANRFARYTPDVIGFIRRCDTNELAEEIVAYLQKKGEIEPHYAKRLLGQLQAKGVRSFGSKKENGYYLRHGE